MWQAYRDYARRCFFLQKARYDLGWGGGRGGGDGMTPAVLNCVALNVGIQLVGYECSEVT